MIGNRDQDDVVVGDVWRYHQTVTDTYDWEVVGKVHGIWQGRSRGREFGASMPVDMSEDQDWDLGLGQHDRPEQDWELIVPSSARMQRKVWR